MTRTLAAAALALAATGCIHPYQAHPCARPDLAGCVIERVALTGNREVPDDAVTGKIATAETSHALGGALENVPILGLWDRLTVDYETFDPFVLQRDMSRVERVYRARGYYDAHARAARVIKRPRDRVYVEIAVDEGDPVRIAAVKPLWLGQVPPQAIQDLVEGIFRDEPLEAPLDEDKFEATKKRVRRALTDAGYAYAHVYAHADVDLITHRAILTYSIDAGPPCTFGPISVEGQGELPAQKLLQAIHITPGQKFSTDRIENAQTALGDLRVLASVDAQPQLSPGGPAPADIRVPVVAAVAATNPLAALAVDAALGADARETVLPVVFKVAPTTLKTLRSGFGAEVGSRVEAHGLVGWENRNFLGGLRHFSAEAKPGVVIDPLTFATLFSKPSSPVRPLFEVRLHAELEQPGFLEPRTRGILSVAANLYQLQPLDTLGYFELAGKTGLSRDWWSKRVTGTLYVNMAFDQPTNLDNYTPIDVARGYHKLILPNVQLIGIFDLRKGENGKRDPLNPHSGFYFANDFQVGWGDSQDLRVRPEMRGYIPIAKRLTLAMRAAGGFLYAFGGDLAKTPTPSCPYDTQLRCVVGPPSGTQVDRSRYIQVLQLRGFSSGGPASNRGYAYNGVGPQEIIPNISPVQSNGALVPIATAGAVLWEASVELRFPVYGNFGATVFLDGSDVRWHLAELAAPFAPHLSSGLGLRYLTPVGPFRADFGVRIPGAQVLGKGTCPAYDPNGSPASSTCYLDPRYGQAGPVLTLPLAVSLAIGEAF